jgi:hypothetical protein
MAICQLIATLCKGLPTIRGPPSPFLFLTADPTMGPRDITALVVYIHFPTSCLRAMFPPFDTRLPTIRGPPSPFLFLIASPTMGPGISLPLWFISTFQHLASGPCSLPLTCTKPLPGRYASMAPPVTTGRTLAPPLPVVFSRLLITCGHHTDR